MNFDNIKTARIEFLACVKAEADAMERRKELELDAAIARREGKEEIAQGFEAEHKRVTSDVWYPAYSALKPAAEAVCAALELDPRPFVRAL